MWSNIAKRAISKSQSFVLNSHSLRRVHSFLGRTQEPIFPEEFRFRPSELNACWDNGFSEMGYHRHDEFFSHEDFMRRPSFGISGFCPRGYASLAEAEVVSSTDVEEDVSVAEEIQELLQEMSKEERKQVDYRRRRHQRMARGMGQGKYHLLRRRQVKIETEAWELAAKEYKELLMDMCAQKLAPNLPYMKSLFLGWFEPLRDAVEKEQQLCGNGKNKLAYAPYFDQLPADMMSVITMHKLTGLLMTGGEHGAARVVQAACMIGDAIEQEVRIHKFLEKTKQKKGNKDKENEGGDSNSLIKEQEELLTKKKREQEELRKKVTNLMKKQKLVAVRQIVKGKDDSKPWGQDAKAKVGSRLIELLMQTAYIQPPANQLADGPPDIRPAFVHSFRTVMKEGKKTSRRYGIIECNPLVLKGLERTGLGNWWIIF